MYNLNIYQSDDHLDT